MTLSRWLVPVLVFGLGLSGVSWARGPWRAADTNTAGWRFMSPEERVEHQRRMRGFETFEACASYQAEHHAHMAERARRAGTTLRHGRPGACEQLRAQGRLQ